MSTLNSELFQLAMSEEAKPLLDLVNKHIKDNVVPWSGVRRRNVLEIPIKTCPKVIKFSVKKRVPNSDV